MAAQQDSITVRFETSALKNIPSEESKLEDSSQFGLQVDIPVEGSLTALQAAIVLAKEKINTHLSAVLRIQSATKVSEKEEAVSEDEEDLDEVDYLSTILSMK